MNRTHGFSELKMRGNKLARHFQCPSSSYHYLSILEGNTIGRIYASGSSAGHSSMLIVYSYLLGGFQIMGTPITKPEEYAALRLLFEREIIPDLLIPNDVNEVSYSCYNLEYIQIYSILHYIYLHHNHPLL